MLTYTHYTVAVHDLDDAITHYEARFGMQQIGERAHNGIGNFAFQSMGYNGKVAMRLISPVSPETPLARLMADRKNAFNPYGEGIYLLAFECDDVDAFCAQVEADGGRITRVPGIPNVWVHPTASNFVLMEIVPKRA